MAELCGLVSIKVHLSNGKPVETTSDEALRMLLKESGFDHILVSNTETGKQRIVRASPWSPEHTHTFKPGKKGAWDRARTTHFATAKKAIQTAIRMVLR